MKAFLDNLCLNTTCSNCKYGKLPRIADITLGDYWGVCKYHPEMDDDKGTSIVLLNTLPGESFFECAKGLKDNQTMTVLESRLEYAIAGNPCIVRSSHAHKNRNAFMTNLENGTLAELLKKFDKPKPIYVRAFRKGIRGVKKVLKYFFRK